MTKAGKRMVEGLKEAITMKHLMAENKRLRKALSFYAEKTNYYYVCTKNGDIWDGMDYRDNAGRRARKALGVTNER